MPLFLYFFDPVQGGQREFLTIEAADAVRACIKASDLLTENPGYKSVEVRSGKCVLGRIDRADALPPTQ